MRWSIYAVILCSAVLLVGCDRLELTEQQQTRGKIRRSAEFLPDASKLAQERGLRYGEPQVGRPNPYWGQLDTKVDDLRSKNLGPQWADKAEGSLALATYQPRRDQLIPILEGRPAIDANVLDASRASNDLATNFYISRTSERMARLAGAHQSSSEQLKYLRLCRLSIDGAPDPLTFGMQIRLASMEEGFQSVLREAVQSLKSVAEIEELHKYVHTTRPRKIHDVMEGELQEVCQLFDPKGSKEGPITEDDLLSLQLPSPFLGIPENQARSAICARALDRASKMHDQMQKTPVETPADLRTLVLAEKKAVEDANDASYTLELGRVPMWLDLADHWQVTNYSIAMTEAAVETKLQFLRQGNWPTETKIVNPFTEKPFELKPLGKGVRIVGGGGEAATSSRHPLRSVDLMP